MSVRREERTQHKHPQLPNEVIAGWKKMHQDRA